MGFIGRGSSRKVTWRKPVPNTACAIIIGGAAIFLGIIVGTALARLVKFLKRRKN